MNQEPFHSAPNLEKYSVAVADPSTAVKLENYTTDENGCHIWGGYIDQEGYGIVSHAGRPLRAHRVSYWLHKGEITGLLVVDHSCRTRSCINPDHLRLLTHRQNMSIGAPAMQTHCKRGHPLSGDNLKIQFQGTKRLRVCRACSKSRYWEAKAAAQAEN